MASDLLKQSEKEHYEYLVEQYEKGLLDEKTIKILRANGYLPSDKNRKVTPYHKAGNVLSVVEGSTIRYASWENPTKAKWKPDSIINHTQEFYRWIDSITYGVFNEAIDRVIYEKYEWYKAQAFQWFAKDSSPRNYVSSERKAEVIGTEFDRCRQNTLYFAMKYCYVKEGSNTAGRINFVPKEHNCFLFYLLDCGYSLIIGKPRQIFASTTMGIFAVKKMILQANFGITFIAEDDTTVKKIYTEKIRFPFAELPDWFKPNVLSWAQDNFWLGNQIKKGEFGYPNSKMSVIPPSITAINGTSDPLVLIDEIGSIPMLNEMIMEAIPTMFIDKNQDGNLEYKRQIIGWSTGVSTAKGKNAYEREWRRIMGLWEERNKAVGFIPIFLHWTTRCDEKHYKEQKAIYAGGKNLDKTGAADLETNMRIFNMHYPSNYNDMFAITSNTLVSKEIIDEGKSLIRLMPHEHRPVAGYLEPVYDFSQPETSFNDIPYKIIDAQFIPCNDDEMHLATTWRLVPPNYDWTNRYYLGVDPISGPTGHSKFATVVWDKVVKAPVCVMNHRKQHDHRYNFLQSVLLSLYYDTNHRENNKAGIPELVEANIGANYIDYKDRMGLSKYLVYNSQLPEKARGGAKIGIDNKSVRNKYIIDTMTECIRNNYKNIKYDVVYQQLMTFVNKQKEKSETWEALDKMLYFDDVLFALTYAYMCGEFVYDRQQPMKQTEVEKQKLRIKYPLYRDPITGMMSRKAERVRV